MVASMVPSIISVRPPGARPTSRPPAARQVVVWAVRLGGHLVSRMHREGRDKRFDGVKSVPHLFFFYWFMQVRPPAPPTGPPRRAPAGLAPCVPPRAPRARASAQPLVGADAAATLSNRAGLIPWSWSRACGRG